MHWLSTLKNEHPEYEATRAMTDALIRCENLGKRFCRDFKKSLWYGVVDSLAELTLPRKAGAHEDHLVRDKSQKQLRSGEFWATHDVSFELHRGESLALIGGNGAGKTTLLKMLSGLIKPSCGQISIHGRVGALIALGAGFNPLLTGRENVLVNGAILGLSRAVIADKLDDIVEFAGISHAIDAPTRTYSSGMQVRLGFAVATSLLAPDIMLVDEILAVGDISFRIKCYNRLAELRRNGSAFILVSHSNTTVSAFASRGLHLDAGRVKCSGNVSVALESYSQCVREVSEKPAHTPVNTTQHFALRSVTIVTDGSLVDVVQSGKQASVQFDVTAIGRINQLVVHVLLAKSQELAESISIRHTFPEFLEGSSRIELRLAPVCLAAGNYAMKVSFSVDTEVLSYVEFISFEVSAVSERQHPLIQQPAFWHCGGESA